MVLLGRIIHVTKGQCVFIHTGPMFVEEGNPDMVFKVALLSENRLKLQ